MESAALFVDTHDVTLWTESFGRRFVSPLLLIMGAMNQGVFWPVGFCEHLANAGFFVIRYDHRDTGLSSIVDFEKHPYTLSELTNDAVAILDAYHIESVGVVGLSMGGYVARLIAVEHAQRVNALVLISSTAAHRPYMAAIAGCPLGDAFLPPPAQRYLSYLDYASRHPASSAEEDIELRLEGWRVTHGGSSAFLEEEMRELIREAAERTSDATAPFHHGLAVAASPPRTEVLHRISAPTLVIHGLDEPCLPLPHGQALSAGIPGARLMTLDIGHMLSPPCRRRLRALS